MYFIENVFLKITKAVAVYVAMKQIIFFLTISSSNIIFHTIFLKSHKLF